MPMARAQAVVRDSTTAADLCLGTVAAGIYALRGRQDDVPAGAASG